MISYYYLFSKYPHWCNWQVQHTDDKDKKVPGFINLAEEFLRKDITKWVGVPYRQLQLQSLDKVGIILGHHIQDTEFVLAGIDLDNCVSENHQIEPWALDLIEKLDCYTEFSPSKRGLHILVLCKPDIKVGTKQGNIEIYTHNRYFTFTNNIYHNAPLKDCTEFISQFEQTQSQVCVYEPEAVEDEKLNRISNRILKAMFAGSNPYHSDRSGNDSYILTYLLTHKFSKAECLWLMLDERFSFGNKYLERSSGNQYCYDTIENVYDHLVSTGKLKSPKSQVDDDVPQADVYSFLKEQGYTLWYDTWQQLEMCNNEPLDKRLFSKLKLLLNENRYGSLAKSGVQIEGVLYEHQQNPLQDWFNDLTWLGNDTIEQFLSCLTTDTPAEIAQEYIRFWLTNAVAKVYHDIERQNFVLVFHGKQGKYKSKAIMWLAPFLSWTASFDATQLCRINNKDINLAACRKLVIEIGEIQLASKRIDAGSLKDFISKHVVHEQVRYERQSSDYLVTASYIATTNDGAFLTDMSGNRRFAVLENVEVAWEKLQAVNKEQLWAQAKYLYDTGAYKLLPDHAFQFQQEDNLTRVTNIRTLLTDVILYNFVECEHKNGLTNTEVLQAINQIEWLLDPTKHSDVMLLASVLKQLGYTSKTIKRQKFNKQCYAINLAS